ncbi:MAG: beta galactosidase jelly roll domain-containing protein [Syntrophothermus sp.]
MNNYNIKPLLYRSLLFLIAPVLFMHSESNAQIHERKLMGLEGKWKFSIGDDMKWKDARFDDSKWEEIKAPSDWEEQGFNGYDGYAWYRKHFNFSQDLKGKQLFLNMGYIDDVDEVYLNGVLIGRTGTFPPHYETAYNANRVYPLPEGIVKLSGDNVLCVRVYDAQLNGGITSGSIGLFTRDSYSLPDLVLEGMWSFHTGDDMKWAEKDFNDTQWNMIKVPAHWEPQGYPDYDGFAWYRKSFNLPSYLNGKDLVLLMGKIDDKDEVYFNGRQIGHIGNMKNKEVNDRDYQTLRVYQVPKDLLQQVNVVAVRVYDGYRDGGIYEGPVGLITKDKYEQFRSVYKQQYQRQRKNFFQLLFGW